MEAPTSISHRILVYVTAVAPNYFDGSYWGFTITNDANKVFDGYGVISSTNGWHLIGSSGWDNACVTYSSTIGSTNFPTWCDEPTTNDPLEHYRYSGITWPVYGKARGYVVTDAKALMFWQFQYATNKFW